eukprot:2619048-Rhodomonas_salina.1
MMISSVLYHESVPAHLGQKNLMISVVCCKWNENITGPGKWAFAAVPVLVKLCSITLVGAIPGCRLAGVRRHIWGGAQAQLDKTVAPVLMNLRNTKSRSLSMGRTGSTTSTGTRGHLTPSAAEGQGLKAASES